MSSSSKARQQTVSRPSRFGHSSSKTKFRWNDGNGRYLSAGGILPYNEEGFWVILERRGMGKIEWSDIGGKYEFEDCDIWATIAREFGEELYQSASLSRSAVKSFSKESKIVYINGYKKLPVYIGLCVHIDIMGVVFSPEKFLKKRNKTLIANGNLPEACYPSIQLQFIKYTDIEKEWDCMSYRLKKVLEAIIPQDMRESYHKLWVKKTSSSSSPIKKILQRGSLP